MDLFPASVARGGKSRAQAKEQALQMKVVSYDRVHIQVRGRGERGREGERRGDKGMRRGESTSLYDTV